MPENVKNGKKIAKKIQNNRLLVQFWILYLDTLVCYICLPNFIHIHEM